VKPVNLNQLLFHPKSDSLSFYFSPVGKTGNLEDMDTLLLEMTSHLETQEKPDLLKILDKHREGIKKIVKSHPDKSHGFFFSEDLQGYLIIDHNVESFHIICQTFHVRPLLEELFVNPEYLLVNVSLYDIKIYRGDFHHVEIVQQYEFDQLPKNFNAQLSRIYAPEFMGLIPYKTILALKTIAQKIKDLALYHSLPVIVTGLDDMKAIFVRYFDESVSLITHIQEDFYEKTCVEIIERCKKFRYIVMDYYSAQFKERLKRMIKAKRLISDLSEIILAAQQGKILHLVLPTEQKLWGKIDLETGEHVIHKRVTKNSVDILNELAEVVMREGGRIQVLGPHFFPQNATVLAILKGKS
jgi:hypothetical protein